MVAIVRVSKSGHDVIKSIIRSEGIDPDNLPRERDGHPFAVGVADAAAILAFKAAGGDFDAAGKLAGVDRLRIVEAFARMRAVREAAGL